MINVRRTTLKPGRVLFTLAIALAAGLSLGGCDLFQNQLKADRPGNHEVQDYRDALAPRQPKADKPGAGVPELQSYIAAPDQVKSQPLVSISVNQTVPLRDALFELAKQVNYGAEIDPRISGSIIYTARDRPLDEVVTRICVLAGLRSTLDNNTLHVELDTPYQKTYKIDYLSYIRKTSSSVQNNVSLSSSGGDTGGSGAAGSKFQAQSDGEANFFGELQANLQQILSMPSDAGIMRTDADPQISVSSAAPVAVVATPGKGTSVTSPQTTLQVSSLPATANAAAAPVAAGGAGATNFSINKQGGIITVYGNDRQQKQVGDYLKILRRSVTAQVLIEAKVMEVDLSDEFAAGINWGQVAKVINHGSFGLYPGNFSGATLDPAPLGALTITNLHADAGEETNILSAVSRFGLVKALASPRLSVLNNQAAVLNVARNDVYFQLQVNSTTDNGVSQTTVNSTPHNVPEGVLINVQPSINLDDNTISLSVRPTVTRIVGQVADPAVAFLNVAGVRSNIPIVNVQEMDSVINIGSGQAVLMGGLMQDRLDSTQTGVPVLSELPIAGALFRGQSDKSAKTELVIFLKATIIDGAQADDSDRDLYKNFAGDRHPIKL